MRRAACLFVLLSGAALADDALTVAVASNFSRTAEELAREFSARHDIPVRLSRGSTGKLYSQILHGAPFQVFLAADAERPALLERAGRALPGSRFTYAVGALVLWSRDATDCHDALQDKRYSHIAIANPLTAPYGRAAREFLVAEGLWGAVEERVVYGENIAQTLQFVATGNASLGLVSRSQVVDAVPRGDGCLWQVPRELHAPIEQQAVVLDTGDERAVLFAGFLKTREAREIIERHGYEPAP